MEEQQARISVNEFAEKYFVLTRDGKHRVGWFDFGNGRFGWVRTENRETYEGNRCSFVLHCYQIDARGHLRNPEFSYPGAYHLLRAMMDTLSEEPDTKNIGVKPRNKLSPPPVSYEDLLALEQGARVSVLSRPPVELTAVQG